MRKIRKAEKRGKRRGRFLQKKPSIGWVGKERNIGLGGKGARKQSNHKAAEGEPQRDKEGRKKNEENPIS